MEHVERDVALGHAVDEPGDGVLVVVGREARREPETVRPSRNIRRSAGQRRIALEHARRIAAPEDEVLERLPRNGELHAFDDLGADLVRDVPRVIDEHAVPAVGEVERNVLVRLLARCAAVGVPDLDRLTVLDQRTEPFAQAIDEFAHAEGELFVQVCAAVGALDVAPYVAQEPAVDLRVARELDVPQRLLTARGQHTTGFRLREGEAPRCSPRDRRGDAAGDEVARIRVDRDVPVPFLRSDEIEADLLTRTLVVVDAHADHARQGRVQRDREGRPVQGVAAPLDDLRRNRGAERSTLRPQVIRLAPVQRVDSGAEHPESVGELHFSPGVAGMIAMRSASDMRMTAEPPGASASPFARSVEVSRSIPCPVTVAASAPWWSRNM